MYKKFIIILIVLLKSIFCFSQDLAKASFSYKSCYLQNIKIEGKTNLNQFSLLFINSNSNIIVDEKNVVDKNGGKVVEFKIPVKSFTGNNYLMLNDFFDLVDAENHPLIIVEIDENTLENVYLKSDHSVINFYITIAGKTNKVTGQYKAYLNDNKIVMSGDASLKLSDFSIDPPQKMFGMLQVKDNIIIKFDILILGSNT